MYNRSVQKNNLDQNGMTLLETLIALGLFSVVIVFITGLFVSGIKAQTRASEMNLVNNEAGFILERMAREIRMANSVDDMRITHPNGTTDDNPGSRIKFTNHDSDVAVYCQANPAGNCQNPGTSVSISYDGGANFTPITSQNVEVVNLEFYSNPVIVPPMARPPVITIFLELASSQDPSVYVKLQTSVVPRVY